MTTEPADHNTFNPYAAPQANVADLPGAAGDEPVFFPVGLAKLATMITVTFGFYSVYWFYRNWKSVQNLTGDKLNAPIRALFYPLTSYSMFEHIQAQGRRLQVDITINAGVLAIAIFVLGALWRLPDPYWVISFLGCVPLLPVQSEINRINRRIAPAADPNNRLRAWNVVAVIIGGILVALSIAGAFLG
jgi:hypothetical protein